MTANKTSIIILAAGSSSRLGQSKQLLELQGKTLLERACNTALQVQGSHVVVVLGANPEQHQRSIAHVPVSIIINERWHSGMGSSIKKGITQVADTPTEGVVVMVCDQPFVTAEHLSKLISVQQHSGKNIVASTYSNTLGVPAYFNKTLFKELLGLPDDAGAKKLFYDLKDEVATVDFPRGSIDIDTPGDIDNLLKQIE
jgi:molybdenum cofactor cytidylyltransferase